MDRFLMAVNVFVTVAILLTVMTTVIGKVPARVMFLAAIALSGIGFLTGVLRADLFTIVMQGVACCGWAAGFFVRRRMARIGQHWPLFHVKHHRKETP